MRGKEKNLLVQVDKLFRGTNRKSIKTRYRYKEAVYRFSKWLAQNTKLKKFSNIKSRHIYKYVDFMKYKGYEPTTIRQELSGIRFFHGLTESKEMLPGNTRLNLDKRHYKCNVSRAWSNEEYEKAIELAEKLRRIDVVMALKLCNAFGLRIEEAVVLTVFQIKEAIKTGGLYLRNTKGGYQREVPIDGKMSILHYVLDNSKGKERILVGSGDITHKVKKSIQSWVYRNRDKFQDPDRISNKEAKKILKMIADSNLKNNILVGTIKTSVSMHGNRHKYAQESFKREIDNGGDIRYSKKVVSERLGHHRTSITNIYLSKNNKLV